MKTIVCVEDDGDVMELVELILRDPQVRTVRASAGQPGLDAIRALKPDLVVLDLFLPDISGWEIFARIRQDRELRHTKVVVLSACNKTVAAALAPDLAAADDYVTKPFSPRRLRGAVDRLLDIEADRPRSYALEGKPTQSVAGAPV